MGVCARVLSAVSPEFYLVLDPETWKRRLGVLVRNLSTTRVVYWLTVSESSGASSPGLSRIKGK